MIDSDDAYALDKAAVEAVVQAVEMADKSKLLRLIEPLHAADMADMLEQIPERERAALIQLWDRDFDPEVLLEAEEGVRDDILEHLPKPILDDAVKEMDSDEIVYVVEDLDKPEQDRVLGGLDEADRAAVLSSLQFPEGSAGRMMQRELVMAPTHWTVGHAIDFMRATPELPDVFYDIIITDPRLTPVGTVPLSKVMAKPRDVKITTLMDKEFFSLKARQPREDVAYAFAQYHLVSAPVVDDDGRLVGIITIDDAVDAMESESREDMMALAGVGKEEGLTDSIWETTRQRFPWLLINLATAVTASVVIALFAQTIEAIVALAVLMPIVASMGGNGGTQSLTVAVRALATRDLTQANAWRVVIREGAVGLLNGLGFAVIIGITGYLIYGSAMLGVVLAIAVVGTMVVAGLSGILIPVILNRFGVDPALAAGAFVTTVTDVVGFLLFLGLASFLLL